MLLNEVFQIHQELASITECNWEGVSALEKVGHRTLKFISKLKNFPEKQVLHDMLHVEIVMQGRNIRAFLVKGGHGPDCKEFDNLFNSIDITLSKIGWYLSSTDEFV